MSRQVSPSKYFCFTLNNYSDEEYSGILRALRLYSDYFIVGKEIGDKGTPHLQGYFILSKKDRITGIRNKVSDRAHYEVARGTPVDNRVYCSKGEDFEEFGTCPERKGGAGGKKDRDELAIEFRSALANGRSGIVGFADANPGVYAWDGFKLLRNTLGNAGAISRPGINVRWYYGKPGVGKSRRAHEEYPDAYIKEPGTKWWTGYLLEKEVIIDDFGPGGIDINHLLRWFDRYKCYVETKGDMVPLHAESFIVTSNFHPKEIFTREYYKFENNVSESSLCEHPQLPALMRRINCTLIE